MQRLKHVPQDRETYVSMYVERGLSIREIAAAIGASPAFVRKQLKRLGIGPRPVGRAPAPLDDGRTAELYRKLYHEDGFGLRQVAKALRTNTHTVMSEMRRLGIETRKVGVSDGEIAAREREGSVPLPHRDYVPDHAGSPRFRPNVRHRSLDTGFFRTIDSDTKAYALGLVWTDGSIARRHPKLRITLQEDDASTLEMLRAEMGAAPLDRQPPGVKGTKSTATLRVCSVEIIEDLQRLGLCENKCDVLPLVVPPPKEFMAAFVCGLMDGDGSLYRPDYPTICFYNQNAHLRDIVIEFWQSITGKRPPTYTPISEGKVRPRVCEIGERAKEIVRVLYLERSESIAFDRKRLRAQQFQAWRRKEAG